VLAYNTLGMAAATKVTLTGESTALIPVTGYTTSLGYTTTGLLKTQNDPASGSLPAENLTYGYDNHGEVTSLAGSGGASWTYVRAIGYNEFGQAQRYTMGPTTSSVWTDLGYDPQTKNLVDVKVTDSTTSGTVDELAYTFGDSQVSPGAGLLSKTVDKQSNGAVVDTQCYQYDGFTRIAQAWSATDNCAAAPHTGASSTVGGPVAPYWQAWTYDAAGNRKGQVDHAFAGGPTGDTATTYNYPAAGSSTDQPHSLTSTTATGPNAAANTAGYTYDTAGNTLTMSGGALGNQSLTWNDQGKLQSDTTSAGSTSFVYDAGGNVVLRRDPGSTTFYLGDEQIVLNTGTGAVTGTRFYAVAGATVASRTSSGAVSYLVPDRQNTAQLAVNASTQAVTRRQYLPFGQTRGAAPAWAGDKGYVGGNNDAALGLEILGVRMYDPVTGRFLSADPVLEVTDSTQLNGYAYSGNNPVTGSDPTGKMVDPSNGDSYGWTPEQTAPGAPNPYDKVTGKQPKGPDGRFRPNLGSEQGLPPSAKLHGNNLLSKRWTWLYQIMSNVDDSLVKTGITSEPNPEDRYDSSYYEDNDYRMEVRSGWPDRATPDLYEKRIHDIDPGPEDHTDIANKARARMAAEAAQDADVAEGVASADAGMITVDTALKLGGRALIGVAVAYDIYDVYKAPPQERAKTAVKDAASLAGGLAGAEIGAEVGASIGAFGGPVGVVVGGIVGGIAGGIIGSGVAGKATKAVENLFHW
jgi:RHS repeat-associated protein